MYLVVWSSLSHAASPVYYTTQTSFLAAVSNDAILDTYDDPGYTLIQDNATMSAVLGETDYQSTAFEERNVVSGSHYCAGCNGSFLLTFTSTSFSGLSGDGVPAVGFAVATHSIATVPYYAFVTFGDGTTADVALPAPGGFFAVSEAATSVVSIHVGASGGGVLQAGTIAIDDLTLADIDTDGDGTGDGTDNCAVPNADQADGDADGVGDACDVCLGSDAVGDSDGDDVCDDLDACAGDDATGDTDADGVCGDLDVCAGDDATGDGDGDDVCDDLDACAGDDATGDTDGDGVCEDDDLCTGKDYVGDSDGDGLCDNLDICPLGADDADADEDGIPDDCEPILPPPEPEPVDCGCAGAPGPTGLLWLVALVAARRRTASR